MRTARVGRKSSLIASSAECRRKLTEGTGPLAFPTYELYPDCLLASIAPKWCTERTISRASVRTAHPTANRVARMRCNGIRGLCPAPPHRFPPIPPDSAALHPGYSLLADQTNQVGRMSALPLKGDWLNEKNQ